MWTKRFVLNADCLNALTLNVCQGFFVRSILIDRTLFTERRGYGFSVSITVYIILIKCISVWVKYKCFWRSLIFLAQISHLCFSRPDQAVPDRARPQIFIIFCLYCDLNGCFSMCSIVSTVFDSYAYEHHTNGATWAHIASQKPCCGVA